MSQYLSDHVHLGDDLTSVAILDQTLLPNEVKYLTLREPEEMFEAIQALRVRGAPAIGIFAGYALYVLARQLEKSAVQKELPRLGEALSERPPHRCQSVLGGPSDAPGRPGAGGPGGCSGP